MIITHNFTQRSDMIQVTPTKSNRSQTMVTFPQNNYGDWYLADDNSTISYLGTRKMMDGCIILKWLTRLFMPYQENMLLKCKYLGRYISARYTHSRMHVHRTIHAMCNINLEINLFFLLNLVKS